MFSQPPSRSWGRLGHAPASTGGYVWDEPSPEPPDELPVVELSSIPDSAPAPLDEPSFGPAVASMLAPEALLAEEPHPWMIAAAAVPARAAAPARTDKRRTIALWSIPHAGTPGVSLRDGASVRESSAAAHSGDVLRLRRIQRNPRQHRRFRGPNVGSWGCDRQRCLDRRPS